MKRLCVLSSVLLFGCSAAEPVPSAPAVPTASPAAPVTLVPPKMRLPHDVTPVREAVTLSLTPAADVFQGTAEIDLRVEHATSVVWLNGSDLAVAEAHLVTSAGNVPARVVPGGEDFVGFVFDHEIAPGPAQLSVTFAGKVSGNDDRGVFRETEDGAPYLYSQFENIDARRAFPCFDEPGIKHPWQVTLRIPSTDRAFSNTMETAEEKSQGFTTLHFAETKPLPAYLVAFAVGPFEVVDGGATKSGAKVRIVTPKGHQAEGAFAAKSTAQIIDTLETYFGIPYAYGKMDVVPVPRLVTFGAMENAGMITIAMNLALAKHDDETLKFQREYVDTMAHELAHQWFGDLVTMSWWDDVWLNEAFATWMGNKTTQKLHPEWRFDISRLHDAHLAMDEDSLLSARKIRQEIATNDDIQNAFDGITYEKGATVIGMFEQFLGEAAYQKGVRNYLAKHAMKDATSADFLGDLSEGAGRDVRMAFSSFLDQPGLPLVSAHLTCDKGRDASLSLSQERYLPIGSKPDAAKPHWQIPVCARYPTNQKQVAQVCTLLTADKGELALPGSACPAWVMPNAHALGYYHVGYEPKAVEALLRAKELSLAERVSVISDVGALVEGGKLPAGDALARIPELAKNPEPEMVRSALSLLDPPQVPVALRPNFSRFVIKTFSARATKMTWRAKAGESQDEHLLRPRLLSALALVGQETTFLAQARALADAWLDNPASLEADAVPGVLRAACVGGDRKLFTRLVDEAKRSKDDNRRTRILRALPYFRDPAILRDVYALALTKDFDIRESFAVLLDLGRDSEGSSAMAQFVDFNNRVARMAFLKEHFDALVELMPVEFRPELLGIVGGVCTDADLADARTFFEPRAAKITGGPRRLAQAVEGASLCIAGKKATEASLTAFLSRY